MFLPKDFATLQCRGAILPLCSVEEQCSAVQAVQLRPSSERTWQLPPQTTNGNLMFNCATYLDTPASGIQGNPCNSLNVDSFASKHPSFVCGGRSATNWGDSVTQATNFSTEL